MSVYRKPRPYRKSQTYRGLETLLPVVAPTFLNATRCPFVEADDHSANITEPWKQAAANQSEIRSPWAGRQHLANALLALWRQAATHETHASVPWGKLAQHAADTAARWRQAAPFDADTRLPWADFVRHLGSAIGVPWHTPDQHQFEMLAAWGSAAAHAAQTSALWRSLAARGAYVAIPWGRGGAHDGNYKIPYVQPPDPTGPLAFPDLAVYIMIPTITAVVIDGGADLDPLSVTITGDVDSWCWQFEMNIPAATLPLVNPGTNTTPVAIRVTVNGYPWSFIVESYTDNRRFGARGYTIRGRSRSALLADDWAAKNTLLQDTDYNAAQLADHEVSSTGWTMIWDAIDWLVPGGTWSYNDLTPIAAIQQLAQAIGGVLLTDADALNLRVEPRYPVKPWTWGSATPYATIPAAFIDAASGDWRGGSNPNGIYVYPSNSTSGAFVRITGSGGAAQMPMVVHSILTDSGAQAARGTQELAKAGKIKQEPLTIPLLPAPALPGLVPLQSLIEATDESGATWRGQVMGVQITAARSSSAISVRQVLNVERQFRS